MRDGDVDWIDWLQKRDEFFDREFERQNYRTMRLAGQRDAIFRVISSLRRRLRQAVRGSPKSTTTLRLLGCTPDELKIWLQRRFRDGMGWHNYGSAGADGRGWQVDHIRPCASFDLTNPKHQAKCFHFSNLQPIWAADNLAKRDKWPGSPTL
jgi:Prasinovirus endonuclease VII